LASRELIQTTAAPGSTAISPTSPNATLAARLALAVSPANGSTAAAAASRNPQPLIVVGIRVVSKISGTSVRTAPMRRLSPTARAQKANAARMQAVVPALRAI